MTKLKLRTLMINESCEIMYAPHYWSEFKLKSHNMIY